VVVAREAGGLKNLEYAGRSASMTIKAGERMPSGTLKTMTKDGPRDLSTDELFKGKKVVLFSVPGAFTPTCDAKHLPGFVQLAEQLRAKGVDTLACMAVNDVFVMNAWGKSANVGEKILMLADGNGDYAKALGLELDARGFGMGTRGQRFSILVQDGVAKQVNIEAPGQFKVSAAEHVLGQL
jgi:glutaredoxin/glutathione-dependent peroxiredoxin